MWSWPLSLFLVPILYQKLKLYLNVLFKNSAPGRIRTSGLRLRRPLLYPTELLALTKFFIYLPKDLVKRFYTLVIQSALKP